MTKADIAEKIHTKLAVNKIEAHGLLEDLLSIIKNALESGDEVKITGFGKFTVKEKHARKGRNPQTGETITIENRRVLAFKPSQLLKESVNK